MFPHISRKRFLFINLIVASVFPIIIIQVVRLTVQNQNFLSQFAGRQQNLVIEIPPERGAILDRNLKEFASNLKVPSIYASPRLMSEKERPKLTGQVSKILGLSYRFTFERLNRNKSFVWLKRRVSVKEADQIRAIQDPNLGITYETKRFYPHGEMLAHVLGFCNIDNQGVEGLELLHQGKLQGRAGFRYTKRDARGREMVALEKKLVPAVNGHTLMLTIDQHIQYLTEKALDEAFRKYRAAGGVAVVMDPETGAILAMASRPSFDPNQVTVSEQASRRNRAVTDIFEPGSVFKIVTAAAALNEGKVTLSDKFNCENGEWRPRPSRVIHDVHPYGVISFPEVLIKSSNIGTVKIAMRLGERTLYDYVKRFGFGQKTGIDFPGEVSGILRPVEKWSKFSITSIPFGQEVAATALQMLSAISIIANGGHPVKPYLLEEIRDQNGVAVFKHEPVLSEPVIRPETAAAMTNILERVVQEGTGKNAAVNGIRVAGKTGTSQKLNPGGGYSHSSFIGSFIGYAPAEHPMLAMIVSLDNPHPYYYGGTVAAPVFREVMEGSLIHLGYASEEKTFRPVNVQEQVISANASKPALPKNLKSVLPAALPQVR